METDEYLKLAEVEDRMWYFRALHGHIQRELERALGEVGDDGSFEKAGNNGDFGDAVSPPRRSPNAAGAPRPHSEHGARLLDAGCGTGGLIRRLAPLHAEWRWTGVDVSPLACDLARKRLGAAAQIEQASVSALPFPDATFDAVVSADVLYHVEDDAAALREFFRVLRPGGVVVVNVPAYRWLWSYHDTAVHSQRRYGRGELRAKLATAGFDGGRSTFWNMLPFPLVVVRRKLLPAPRGGSDVRLYPAAIESAFNAAMALEGAWLRGGGALPFGSSIFARARKP